ncbi:MAG: P1 family peptidase, partial [Alphaproteobacteria bacterium]|nr:P1 family peptidase [Alphaproteobacteria bacterium]
DVGAIDTGDLSDCAPPRAGTNTTIAVVATDAALTKVECRRLAIMAQTGLARAIRPVHTPYDGDTVFALATGQRGRADAETVVRLGALAADCLARAVARAVYAATTTPQFPSYRDRHGTALRGGRP